MLQTSQITNLLAGISLHLKTWIIVLVSIKSVIAVHTEHNCISNLLGYISLIYSLHLKTWIIVLVSIKFVACCVLSMLIQCYPGLVPSHQHVALLIACSPLINISQFLQCTCTCMCVCLYMCLCVCMHVCNTYVRSRHNAS